MLDITSTYLIMKFLGIRHRGNIFTYSSLIFITTPHSRSIYPTINIIQHFASNIQERSSIKRFINQPLVYADVDKSNESFIVMALKSPDNARIFVRYYFIFIKLHMCAQYLFNDLEISIDH